MKTADGHGIAGLLDQILSTGDTNTPERSTTGTRPGPCRAGRDAFDPAGMPATAARRGRPPGKGAVAAGPKQKVTLRITSTLVASYRDWSWEARSQLSELVERALANYHDQYRSQQHAARHAPRKG